LGRIIRSVVHRFETHHQDGIFARLSDACKAAIDELFATDEPESSAPEPDATESVSLELISQQYDEMVKYATALHLGTADPEAILRRFTRNNATHPTYLALAELGKAIKTIFLCRYLHDEGLHPRGAG
jgi:TnpA family transposase